MSQLSKGRAALAGRMMSGAALALLTIGAVQLAAPTAANAKPEYAAQTGLPCGQCHVNPAGGGKLKSFGEKFKANGYKVKK